MGLPQDKLNMVIAHLTDRLGGKVLACPSCSHDKWDVGDLVSSLPYVDGVLTVGGQQFPVVPLVCTHCYFVAQYAWVPIERDRGKPAMNPLARAILARKGGKVD